MNTDIRIETTFKGHRKRRRLNEILQREATGYLLDLWITIAQERPSGVLTNWDEKDIALAAGWEGDAQQFVDALMQAKLLDVNGDKVFHPHDWEEHQPWVSGTTERREIARKAGLASAIARANKASEINTRPTQANTELKTVDHPLNGMATQGQPRTHTGPYRTPINKIPINNSILAHFDSFWKAYPKKKSKGQAEKAFVKVNPDDTLLAIILAAIKKAMESPEWLKDDGKWIPYPATWLNAKGWEDEIKEGTHGTIVGNRIPKRYHTPEEADAIDEAERKHLYDKDL